MTHLETLISRYPALEPLKEKIQNAYAIMETCYENGGKVLLCGNGGSSADSGHIVGELMKDFCLPRPVSADFLAKLDGITDNEAVKLGLHGALPAIDLTAHSALISALVNDGDPSLVFAQQVYGYGKPGDVLVALSTSGNSANVVRAVEVALALDMQVVAITGLRGGRLKALAQAALCLPETETYKIQELTLPLYHTLCLMLEEHFFG